MMARVNLKEYGNKQGETAGGCAVKMPSVIRRGPQEYKYCTPTSN